MGKTAFFAGLLTVALCSGALAQSQPLVSPTATPVPPETVKNQTFTLNDTVTGKPCLRMTVALVVNITYINSQKENASYAYPLTNGASILENNSTCHVNSTTASLYIVPGEDNPEVPFTILFKFTGDSATGKKHWAWGNMTFILDDAETLEDYGGKAMGRVDFMSNSKVHGDSNSQIEFQRSYKCVTDQVLNFTAQDEIHPYVHVSKLQAQAFEFSNSSKFDDARVCLLDSAGKANKIVPIAVGAALAGLVVVVLIAYLIGRLRSRRQSSYEALS